MSSTPRDPRTYLWDARRAAERIRSFVGGRTWEDYQADDMLRSAVERQFEIVGEALNKLSQVDAASADRVPDLARIVAFRNILVHGYASIDDRLVWEAATTRVEPLIATVDGVLGDDGPEPID